MAVNDKKVFMHLCLTKLCFLYIFLVPVHPQFSAVGHNAKKNPFKLLMPNSQIIRCGGLTVLSLNHRNINLDSKTFPCVKITEIYLLLKHCSLLLSWKIIRFLKLKYKYLDKLNI